MKVWWLDRMAAVTAPTPERLTWFWHGHFATSEEKVNRPNLMLAQNQTLRRLGLSDFRSLTQAMIADPAMIMWLDGQTNRLQEPNENLGRELMELFTLGVGHYSETDVRESARALTGWSVDPNKGTATLRPAKHDATVKTVLGRAAPYDADGLVDLLVGTPESARFVATRLWTRLVSPVPPDAAELDRLAVAYGPRTDLTALLRAIATSTAFHDPASSLVKAPVEWATGLARALGARPAALDDKSQKDLLEHSAGVGAGAVPAPQRRRVARRDGVVDPDRDRAPVGRGTHPAAPGASEGRPAGRQCPGGVGARHAGRRPLERPDPPCAARRGGRQPHRSVGRRRGQPRVRRERVTQCARRSRR